jgi:hypothetical protein
MGLDRISQDYNVHDSTSYREELHPGKDWHLGTAACWLGVRYLSNCYQYHLPKWSELTAENWQADFKCPVGFGISVFKYGRD